MFSEFRDVTKSIGRKVVSKKFGQLEDSRVIIDSTINPTKTTVMQLTIEGSTREVTIDKFKFE